MLTLMIGRAGTGKTRRAMGDFAARAGKGQTNLYYIVPEQYSHDAERQLLKACSDALSLHGEVLSFSRLCSRVFAETGGATLQTVDKGGRLLYMSRALDAVSAELKTFGATDRKADFLENLTAAAGELKSARVTPDDLLRASGSAASPLREKLYDLSLILSAYDAYFAGETTEPNDRLTYLSQVLTHSTLFRSGHIYFDGFADFTAQEMDIVEKLIAMRTDMTVCLTCDGLDGEEPLFEMTRKTARRLLRAAADSGVASEIVALTDRTAGRPESLETIEQTLFSAGTAVYNGPNDAVELYSARTISEECELAAARVLALVRDGYRWRDIGVAVCDYASAGRLAEDIFTKYGVPVFVGSKAEMTQKPPLALLESALALMTGGWNTDSVSRYLKTGMTDLSFEECDALENYALLWDLKGSLWTRDEDWTLPLSGYERDISGDGETRLETVNALRSRAVGPLLRLRGALAKERTYGGKLRALYQFIEEIGLPDRIAQKEMALRDAGDIQLADEYRQLWDIIVRAMDQLFDVLGENTGSNAEFARLWKLLVSQYDIASIPVALDRVGLGELSRQRRRGLKVLLVIGASDDVLPDTAGGGLLSDSERQDIRTYGIQLPGGAEERLYRELNNIYSALALPTDKLIVSWHTGVGEKRPSFIVERLAELLGLTEHAADTPDFRTAARSPCFELAASYMTHGGSGAGAAAFAYFKNSAGAADRLRRIEASADLSRGRLSVEAASQLYGRELVMSASRVDRYYACRFQYFLQYGLSAKPRRPAGFDAPTAGTFMHYVLENVTKDIKLSGGFADIDEETCRNLTEKHADRYAEEVLQAFKDKTSRFIYLFNRLKNDAAFIAWDMVSELRDSDFEPLDFELEFSDTGDIPPRLVENAETQLKIKGFVDRLDGWRHNGKLYIRVVDYKTGRKKFSLSDVNYGMNMQMLIYLFALEKNGAGRYETEIVPAGVLYAPAREDILPAARSSCDDELDKKRAGSRRRSGLILDDPIVVDAMEHASEKRFLPVRSTDARAADVLADSAQFKVLSDYIDKMLLKIADGIRDGRIEARPYYKNRSDTACLYCDYRSACHFSEKNGDKRRYLKKLTGGEAWREIAGEADA